MSPRGPDIVILDRRIDPRELERLTQAIFLDMVKYVVDVRRRLIAIGGELHADGESLLLESGSRQEDIWEPTTTRAGVRRAASNTRP